MIARALPVLVTAWLLSGCMVGPDFSSPDLSPNAGYTPEPLPRTTASTAVHGGAAHTIVAGADVPGGWWKLFKSDRLNTLVEQAVANNPDIASARASLREAQETALATAGGLFPSVTGSSYTERIKGTPVTTPYKLYNATVDVSYTLDIFGGTRRSVEAARADAEYEAFEAEAAYLTITANVVTGAIQEASLNAQIRATQEIISAEQKLLDLLKLQVDVGLDSNANVLQQQASLAETRASLPALEKELAQQRNALAALVGVFPNEYTAKPFTLDELTLPRELPLSLPSTLVRQRPDVRAAEAQLHEACANIGVAVADMLPEFTLTPSMPSTVYKIANLLSAKSIAWTFEATVSQTLFEGGELLHTKRAAVAAYDAAAADYRSTVLGAFEDVANALRAVEADARALRARLEAENAARDSLKLTQAQFKVGTISYIDVLTAQGTYETARIERASAQATRFADVVALFEALGGGWWNRVDLPELQPEQKPAQVAAREGVAPL